MDTMPSFTDLWTNAIFIMSEWLLELEGLELLLLWLPGHPGHVEHGS
jgi:hypothetical protein